MLNHHCVGFSEVSSQTWNAWVAALPDATYLHEAGFLQYLHALLPDGAAKTFALLNDANKPIALCPFAISTDLVNGMEMREGTWKGAPIPYPAIAGDSPTSRRRLVRLVFEQIQERARIEGLGRIQFRRYPISRAVMNGVECPVAQMEALAHGYTCLPQNTVVMALRRAPDALEAGMTSYHRRRIHRSRREGLRVHSFRGNSSEARNMFESYQQAHVASAGRLTRPHRTFDLMCDAVLAGRATLFVAALGDTPLSFLLCGEFERMAFGWSQVNMEAYEAAYSPRHLLEWEAILDYQRRGFIYYEVGTRWYGPQLYYCPSPKELTIAEFKERYGGQLWPDLWFERFFQRDFFEATLQRRLACFLASDYFVPARVSVEAAT